MRKIYFVLFIILLAACDQSNDNNNSNKATVHVFSQPYKNLLIYPKKNLLPEFNLISQDDSAFTQAQFKGYWSIIFMGFTNCPDICPTTLMDINTIYQALPENTRQKLQVIFLSVDPKRDTPEHLKNYISHFHDDFIGITGEKAEIDKLVKSLGGIYTINTEDEKYYTVDHTARLFIVGPAGERYGIVSSEAMHKQDKMPIAKDLESLIQ